MLEVEWKFGCMGQEYLFCISSLYYQYYKRDINVYIWLVQTFKLMFKGILFLIEKGEGREREITPLHFFSMPLLNWPSTSAHKFKYTKLCFSCRRKNKTKQKHLIRTMFFFLISEKLNKIEIKNIFTTSYLCCFFTYRYYSNPTGESCAVSSQRSVSYST